MVGLEKADYREAEEGKGRWRIASGRREGEEGEGEGGGRVGRGSVQRSAGPRQRPEGLLNKPTNGPSALTSCVVPATFSHLPHLRFFLSKEGDIIPTERLKITPHSKGFIRLSH